MTEKNQIERRENMAELAAELKYLNDIVNFKLTEVDKKLDVIIKDSEQYEDRIRKLEEKNSTIKGYFLGLGALGALLSDKITKLLA